MPNKLADSIDIIIRVQAFPNFRIYGGALEISVQANMTGLLSLEFRCLLREIMFAIKSHERNAVLSIGFSEGSNRRSLKQVYQLNTFQKILTGFASKSLFNPKNFNGSFRIERF